AAELLKKDCCRHLLFGGAFGLFRQLSEKIVAGTPELGRGRNVALEVSAYGRLRLAPGSGRLVRHATAPQSFSSILLNGLSCRRDPESFHDAYSLNAFLLLHHRLARPLAQIGDDAVLAARLARHASVAPVQDKPMVRV